MIETKNNPFLDKKGNPIKDCSLIKIFHFKERNEMGTCRKVHYLYRWVRFVYGKWTALSLNRPFGKIPDCTGVTHLNDAWWPLYFYAPGFKENGNRTINCEILNEVSYDETK